MWLKSSISEALLGELDLPTLIFQAMFGGSFTLMMLLLIRSARPLEVIVGTDGVVLRRAWTRRFIPCSTLDDVALNGLSHLVLLIKSGRELVISKGDDLARRALCGRIREAMRAQGDGSTEGRAENYCAAPGRILYELKAMNYGASEPLPSQKAKTRRRRGSST
ncbi:MAG TPA: hypothetical protein VK459_00750 [Polyangiaceae bacterium]|nr:hypothetical protein [Polyangiaceae bacterium]